MVTNAGLCFGFVLGRVLKTQESFPYSWATRKHSDRAFFAPCIISSKRLGVHKELGGNTAGIGDPSWLQEYSIPHGMRLSKKSLGKEEHMNVWGDGVFPSHYHMDCSPAFLQLAEHLPDHVKQQINSLFCFACLHGFCFIYQTCRLSLSWPKNFTFLLFQFSPSACCGGNNGVALWYLVASWG